MPLSRSFRVFHGKMSFLTGIIDGISREYLCDGVSQPEHTCPAPYNILSNSFRYKTKAARTSREKLSLKELEIYFADLQICAAPKRMSRISICLNAKEKQL